MAVADPARLEQALTHLVQNAIEASPQGEPVTIRLKRDGAEACIDVADRGIGMSAAFIDSKLFKPFTSTKENGFGIGTFEARTDIVEMGGRIQVTSREGRGTTFAITLPAAAHDVYQTPEALVA
jgi:signal transduction histidine kinase